MVFVLPEVQKRPSTGQLFAQKFGAGIEAGTASALETLTKMAQLSGLSSKKDLSSHAASTGPDLSRITQDIESKTGSRFSPRELESLRSAGSVPTAEDDFSAAKKSALLGEPALSRVQTEEAKENVSRRKENEKVGRERATKALEKVDASQESLRQRRTDYEVAKNAMAAKPGDIGSLRNFVADTFHLPMLKSAQGAAFSSAMKDAYIKTVSAIGSRPNQWIEQHLQTAMAQIGQTDLANRTAIDLGLFKLDTEENHNEIMKSLANTYLDAGQAVPGNIEQMAYTLERPFFEQREKELAYDLREIYEKEGGPESLKSLEKVPPGTPLTIERAQAFLDMTKGDIEAAQRMAKRLGYEEPSEALQKKKHPEIFEEEEQDAQYF